MMDPLLEQFLQEARENLAFIDQNIDEIGGDDPELLHSVFRAAHTLKGGSGIVGFESVKEITHHAEDLLDMLRGGKLEFKPSMTEALFDAFDEVMNLIEAAEESEEIVDADEDTVSAIVQALSQEMGKDANEVETWKLLQETGKKGRRTGLGFTALADTIAALGLKFDTSESIAMIDEIMRTKLQGEFDSSVDMAITRGSFEGFNPNIENTSEFVQMMEKEFPELYKRMMENGRRNISVSTVAPTGSLSMLAHTSSGVEPVFLLSYKRRRKVNQNDPDRKSTRLNSSHVALSRMPASA